MKNIEKFKDVPKEWLEILGVKGFEEINSINIFKWKDISKKPNLPAEFMEMFFDKLDLFFICKYQKLLINLIEKHWGFWSPMSIKRIGVYQELPIEFIERHIDDLDIFYICRYQKLPMEFIEKHFSDIGASNICIYQRLTEEFMEKHWNKLSVYHIAKFQILSDGFIEKHPEILRYCSRKPIVYSRDVLPQSPCKEGSKRFLELFGKDQKVLWNDLLEKYLYSNRILFNNIDYMNDINWYLGE